MIEIYQSSKALPLSVQLMASDQYKRNLSIQLAIWIHLNWSPFLVNMVILFSVRLSGEITQMSMIEILSFWGEGPWKALTAILVADKEHFGGVQAPGWWRQLPEEVIAPPTGAAPTAPTATRWPPPSLPNTPTRWLWEGAPCKTGMKSLFEVILF